MNQYLSTRTQLKLAQLIASIAEAEKRTEIVRQILAEQKQFEPYTAFRRLDQQRTGELTQQDLLDFLRDNKIPASSLEINYIFQRLDQNRDGRITYPDFVKSILPKEDQRLRQLASLRESYYLEVNMLLPNEVEWALSRVFEQEIVNYRTISTHQELLKASYDFTSLDAFRSIDLAYLGYITLDSLQDFMQRSSVSLTKDEGQAFFRVVDLDEDGRITYGELLESLTMVPDYFQTNQELLYQLRRSRELNELNRSRDRVENLKISQELLDDQLRKSRERIEQYQIQQEIDYIQGLQRQATKLSTINELQKSTDRLEELRRSRQLRKQELLQNQDLRRSQDRIDDLRRSRERLYEIEQLRHERERLNDLRRSRERIEELNRSQERIEELRRSRERVNYLQDLNRSRERELQLRKSREEIIILDELRRSRERLDELRLNKEKQEYLDYIEAERLRRDYDRLKLEQQIDLKLSQERLRNLEMRVAEKKIEQEVLNQSKIVQSRIYDSPKKQFRS